MCFFAGFVKGVLDVFSNFRSLGHWGGWDCFGCTLLVCGPIQNEAHPFPVKPCLADAVPLRSALTPTPLPRAGEGLG